MQRLSENGARPVATLGRLNALPGLRLGALVFQPYKTEPLYWASLWAPTRIAGCALGHRPTDTRWENVSPERRSASRLTPVGPTQLRVPLRPGQPPDPSPISFSLWTVFAEHTRKTPGSSTRSCRGADASAIHGRTERSGCTAAEPYPLSRGHTLPRRPQHNQTN